MIIGQIYEGWRNNLLPPKELKDTIAKVGEERLEICKACNYHSKNRKDYKTVRPDDHCTNCGCTLAAKTKCLSCSCPINKWGPLITQQQEEEMRTHGKQ